jgi:hypothetical protein
MTKTAIGPVTVTIDSGDGDSGPTATAGYNLEVGLGATLQIIGGGSLTVTNIVDVFGTIDVNSNIQDPTFTAQGPVTVEALGTIEAIGSAATIYFSDINGTTVTDVNGNSTIYTVDNFGTISAGQSGQVFFEQSIVKNESTGQIVAQSGGAVTFEQGSLDNAGTVTADNASVSFEQVTVTNESGAFIIAQDGGSLTFDQGSLDNFGTVSAGTAAVGGGTLSFEHTTVTNELGGVLEAANGGLLTIHDDVANAGQLLIANGGTMALINDTITGGQINLSSAGASSELQIGGTVTFTGGTVTLSDNAQNAIVSNGAAAQLINYDGMSGAGAIGNGDAFFTLINEPGSIIAAAGTNALVIDNDSPATNNFAINEIVNSGTIEATGTGGLTIENTTIDNSTFDPNTNTGVDGHIEAFTGSHIDLDNATILQGFVTVDAGATLSTVTGSSNEIETANGPTHNTAVASISFAGTVSISDDSSLILASPYNIENSGAIELNSTGDKTFLYFDQPAPILSGGGTITLEGGEGTQDIIAGLIGQGYTTVQLDNQNNAISGAGKIGQDDGHLTLQNDTLGKVDANISGQTLTIDTGSGVTDTNAGLLEATDGGILVLSNTAVTNTAAGTITVSGSAAALALESGSIDHGTLGSTGTVEAKSGTNTISDVTNFSNYQLTVDSGAMLTLTDDLVSGGTITVDSGAVLDLTDTDIVNAQLNVDSGGVVNVFGTTTIDTIKSVLTGQTTVESGQVLILSDELVLGNITIEAASGLVSAGTLKLTGDDIINDGAPGYGVLDNAGQIIVSGTNNSIENDDGTAPGGVNIFTNSGTLEVQAGATLTLSNDQVADSGSITVDAGNLTTHTPGLLTLDAGTIAGVTVSGGIVALDSATSTVSGATTIENATLQTGTFDVASGVTLTLDDDSLSGLTISGGIVALDSATSTVSGATTIENATLQNGTLDVASGATLTLDGDSLAASQSRAVLSLSTVPPRR